MIKGAVIGLRHGKRHVDAFLSYIEKFSFFAVCDLDPIRLSPYRSLPNIKAYTQWQAIPLDLNFVVISLPNHLHVPLILYFLERSDALIICEKPLARNFADASSIMSMGSNLTNRVKVIHELRLNPTVTELRYKIMNQQIEKCELRWHRQSLPPAEWYINQEVSGGGVLMDLGIHLLDLLIYLLNIQEPDVILIENVEIRNFKHSKFEDSIIVNMKIPPTSVRIDTAWQDGKGEIEIEVAVQTNQELYILKSYQGAHRILKKNKEQQVNLYNWYKDITFGLPNKLTPFEQALVAMQFVEKIYMFKNEK